MADKIGGSSEVHERGAAGAPPVSSPGKRTLTEALVPSALAGVGGAAGQGTSAAPAAPAVQREDASGGGPRGAGGMPGWDYVERHRVMTLAAIRERMVEVGLPAPHPRLRWSSPALATATVASVIRSYVEGVPGLTLKRLANLSYPADVVQAVDQARNRRPEIRWLPEVGRAVAEAFDVPLVTSIQRMGQRLRVQLDGDAHGVMPRGASLVASNPLDGVIADALVSPGVVTGQAAKAGAGSDTPGKPFAGGAVEVELEWLGKRDPQLWNWIRVTSPAHATAEDVARTPLAGGEVTCGSEQAYRIAASPPYFGIPVETARLVRAAWEFAPDALKAGGHAQDLGPRVVDGVALAASKLADEAALAQVGPPGKADLPPERALDRAEQQLAYLQDRLAPWRAHRALGATRAFLARRADQGHDPRALQRWAPVLASVERTLFEVASDVRMLLESLERAGARPDQAAALEPMLQVLRAYAQAAGVAHLPAQAAAALRDARRQSALLPIAVAEDRIRIARGTVAAQQAEQGDAGSDDARTADTGSVLPGLATRAADLRLHAARGAAVDAAAAEDLAADADETILRADIALFQTRLATVEHRAIAVNAATRNAGGWTIAHTTQYLRAEAGSWLSQLARTRDPQRTEGASNATRSRSARTAGSRRTLAAVRAQMTHLREKANVEALLQQLYTEIADQELRNIINAMALQIGLMLVTGEIAGAGVAAIRGVMLARELVIAGEVIESVRSIQLGYSALEMVSQAALQTVAQGATGGPADGRAFGENLAGIALTSIVLRPFQGLVGDASELEREVRTWADAMKAGAKAAVSVPAELGAGIVAAGTAHAAITGAPPHATESDEIVSQGIALVASKFVHRHVQEMRARITRATSGHQRAEAEALLQQVAALEAATAPARVRTTLLQARGQLAQHATLLGREGELFRTRPDDLASPAAQQARAENAADQARLSGSFLEISFRLAGLHPVVDGAVYEGTPTQIADALAQADRSGMPPSRMRDAATRTWHVTSGERPYKLHETGVVLAGSDAGLRAAARGIAPDPRYIDIVVHASADSFWVVRDGVEIAVDHRALAAYARKHGLEGKQIRLVACNAGASEHAIAQDLANKLGVDVLAPTKTAWINGAGEIGVGVRDVDDGAWKPFKPQHQPPPRRPATEAYREPPELRTPDGSEVDPPVHVRTPVVDNRAPVRFQDFATLTSQLGVTVAPELSLGHGVEVRAVPRKGWLGYDMAAVEVRVGPDAIMSDVLGHADTVNALRRDNSLLGKLRQLADRMFARPAAAGTTEPSRFPPGSRGYVTELELRKLERLIDDRRAQHRAGAIDDQVLHDEVQFLAGELAYHSETLQSLADTGYLVDPSVALQSPDIGAVTRQAQAAGYKLPGEAGGVGEHASPAHYYYRRSTADPSQFELARKPTAPAEAPGYRARVSAGKFSGLIELAEPGATPSEIVPVEWTKDAVVARLRETSFGPYAAMLERHGLASHAVIDAAITTARGRRNQAGAEATLDGLRREVKQYFRDRVTQKLLDPSLDATASYQNMRSMVEGLNNADRGALVQLWYTRRNAPTAKTEQKYQVTRTSGEHQGKIETRVADLVVGNEVREVKDVQGKIDEDQFRSYLDLLRDSTVRDQLGVNKLRYVFTHQEGAIANLERLADAMGERDIAGRLTVEVFDSSGASHAVDTPRQALALLKSLKSHQVVR